MTETILRSRPAVFNVNDCVDFGIGAAPLLRRLRRHCLVVDVIHVDHPDPQLMEFRTRYADALDGVVSSSEHALGRFLRSSRRVADLPSRYVPYGVDAPAVVRSPPGAALRLLYAGRLVEEQKRVSLLPSVAAALRERGIPFRLTIVGDGPAREELERSMVKLKLADAVEFTGFVDPDAMPSFFASNDFLLNVSDYEGFPLTIIEAMACGCIPLGTDVSSLDHRVLRSGMNCLLVPVAQPLEIVRVLGALRREDIERISLEATATGSQFSTARMISSYESFFAEIGRNRRLRSWDGARLQGWHIQRSPWSVAPTLGGRLKERLNRTRDRIARRS